MLDGVSAIALMTAAASAAASPTSPSGTVSIQAPQVGPAQEDPLTAPVPGAPADSPALPDPQQTAPAQSDGEIVVTGLRRSVQGAQALKRDSDQILDAVVAEDIGKLPDNNAAEALARITGVQVSRSQDEANGVSVRGLPDVTTTFNGRELYTAEGRQVAFQDFPAASLAGIEVYKSTTADLVEGGIAGLVNVRSRRPFDFDGFEIAGSIRYEGREMVGASEATLRAIRGDGQVDLLA